MFIYPFSKYILDIYYVLGTDINYGTDSKQKEVPALMDLRF